MKKEDNTQQRNKRRRPTQSKAQVKAEAKQDTRHNAKRGRGRPRKENEQEDGGFDYTDHVAVAELFQSQFELIENPEIREAATQTGFANPGLTDSPEVIRARYLQLAQYVVRNNYAFKNRDKFFLIRRPEGGEATGIYFKDQTVDLFIEGKRTKGKKSFLTTQEKSAIFVDMCRRFEKIMYPSSVNIKTMALNWSFRDVGTVLRDAEHIKVFSDVVFRPGFENDPDSSSFNIWTGWGRTPYDGDDYEEKCPLIMRHIRDIMCNKDATSYRFLMNWLAHMIQRPWEPTSKALTFISRQGTGKNTVFSRILREIVGLQHYYEGTSKDQFVGHFNKHLEGVLLGVADEALFYGDKQAQDAFKSLIASDMLQVEEKYKSSYKIQNCMRLVFLTNHDRANDTEADNRRYVIFEVSNEFKDCPEYFNPLYAEIGSGGIEAFFRVLKEWKLEKAVLEKVPDSPTMRKHVEMSLDAKPIDSFLNHICETGEFRSKLVMREISDRYHDRGIDARNLSWLDTDGQQDFVASVVYDAFNEYCRSALSVRNVPSEKAFWMRFDQVFESVITYRGRRRPTLHTSNAQELEIESRSKDYAFLCAGKANVMQATIRTLKSVWDCRACVEEHVLGFPKGWPSIGDIQDNDLSAPVLSHNAYNNVVPLKRSGTDDIPF